MFPAADDPAGITVPEPSSPRCDRPPFQLAYLAGVKIVTGCLMPRSTITWQLPPAEGFYTSELPTLHAQPVRTFLPTGYEPNYPYPLVVLFHGHAGSDEQVLRFAPRISRRNYVCISLRGPHSAGANEEGVPSFSWGNEGENDSFIEEYMLRAVEQTRRSYHIHSERIYLAGMWEGASLAYRLGLSLPEKIAGIISLNGTMPRPSNGGPLFRFPDVRQLRVFIGHGVANPVVPLDSARPISACFTVRAWTSSSTPTRPAITRTPTCSATSTAGS